MKLFSVILKQFHLSHVTVADPGSSDSIRLYPIQIRALHLSLIQYPQNFCSARLKNFSLQKLRHVLQISVYCICFYNLYSNFLHCLLLHKALFVYLTKYNQTRKCHTHGIKQYLQEKRNN